MISANSFVPEAAPKVSGLMTFIDDYKALVAIPALVGVLVVVWLFFRKTWLELDGEALHLRGELHAQGKMDHRPFIAMVMIALILTMQEYSSQYYLDTVHASLVKLDAK